MLRTIMMTGTAICLSLGSSLALADHDRELRYVVAGAILGAALGEFVYAADAHPAHGYRIYDHGYRYGVAYPPPRVYRRGRAFRHHWRAHHHYRDYGRRGHRHGSWRY